MLVCPPLRALSRLFGHPVSEVRDLEGRNHAVSLRCACSFPLADIRQGEECTGTSLDRFSLCPIFH